MIRSIPAISICLPPLKRRLALKICLQLAQNQRAICLRPLEESPRSFPTRRSSDLLLLSFTFQKDVAKGSRSNGTVVGIVTMKAKLLNSRGKEILNKIYTAKTAEPIKIKRSEYDTDSLLTGLEEAIDSAVRQLCMEISKMSYDSIDEATETKEENSVKATAIALPVRTKTADADAPAESVSPAESAEVNP